VEPFSDAIIFPHTHTRDSIASFPFSNKSTIIATDDRYDGLCLVWSEGVALVSFWVFSRDSRYGEAWVDNAEVRLLIRRICSHARAREAAF